LWGVAAAMEEEQLAAQRQTYLGCPIVARCGCPSGAGGCKRASRGRPLRNIKTTTRWIRLPRLKLLRWIWTGNTRMNSIARWAHDTSDHQGRDATYRWSHDRGVDLTMDTIAQVIHERETRTAIKQVKRTKPQRYGGRWLKYKYGEA